MTRTLFLTNSLTRKKEAFAPQDPSRVRLYACGPTVYNYAHIGNGRAAVVFDQLARVLRRLYGREHVIYASNITDVDDKIMAAAAETGESIDTITRRYEDIYNQDMAVIGVEKPDLQPRATEHIPEMIDLISRLIAQGHAYAADGHVLFHVPSFPAYGGLSGRSRDDQIAGARVEVAPFKKDPADFVLWKPSSPDQPGWDSPWGRGRPGWHIECSAMSEKHLGLPFDIHGGGADLKFPHHENEIAQSCCAHGAETDLAAFARMWVHNGFVTVEGEKMSKSLGNFTLVHDLTTKGIAGEVIRFALLSGHYSQPLDWTDKGVQQASATLDRLYGLLDAVAPEAAGDDAAVLDALCDDLNTPKAIAALNLLSTQCAKAVDPAEKARIAADLKAGGALLGLLQQTPDRWFGREGLSDQERAQIEALIAERWQAKQAKDFARADALRGELDQIGVSLEDTAQHTIWRRRRG